jgi:hypothetical protein
LKASGLGLKSREPNFDFWGRAQNIGVLMGCYPSFREYLFGIWHFAYKTQKINQILRSFHVMQLFELRPHLPTLEGAPNVGASENFGFQIFGIK